MKSLGEFCKTLNKVDFDSLKTQLDTVESMNLHLQHFLIEKEDMKDHQERTKKVGETVESLDGKVAQLREQVQELLNRPQLEQSGPTTLTDKLVDEISLKLDQTLRDMMAMSQM